jgi:hypothetical protein
MTIENPALSTLLMDRSDPLGNSVDNQNRRALHTKITNLNTEVLPIGGFLSGVVYDALSAEYTTTTIETYRYYLGGISGTLQATIVVTYTDVSKANVSTVVRT